MKYRKKPVVIDAIKYTGENRSQCIRFIGQLPYTQDREKSVYPIIIQTLEGVMRAEVGDWIIKGVKGEFYPCKPDIFEATYEKAE